MTKFPATNPTPPDLEIKDAALIFNNAWEELVDEIGTENLRFPKELILLGGAPGSGKGTQTGFIMRARGLTCPPIVVSQLLNSPEAQKIKDMGRMVGDLEVVGILFRELLKEEYRNGALLDGFPRTRVQVECLKMLVDRIDRLSDQFADTRLALHFRRPTIRAMVLFVSEKTSVNRQIIRGEQIARHNQEVLETGVGEIQELRPTDTDVQKARNRYEVFKEQTWDALRSLKEVYHYHFINAEGPIEEVEANILQELQYQSSLELDHRTFDRISPIPLAEEIIVHARQELVRRLDGYELEHRDLFIEVVDRIQNKFLPIIQRHALSGRAVVNSEDPLFSEPLALSMLIDVFSERGFHAVVDKQIHTVAETIDLNSGEIKKREKHVYRIDIQFKGSSIRRG